MLPRRRLLAWTAGAAATLSLPPLACAQADYPKPGATLRYIVPFPPGGLTDVMARLVGQQLGARWGVNVVVDNKPGNGGQIGADAAAKSPGDGQTLLAITLTHAANVTLYKGRAPYDFQRDLKPVALLAGSPMLVVVPAASAVGFSVAVSVGSVPVVDLRFTNETMPQIVPATRINAAATPTTSFAPPEAAFFWFRT